MVNHMTLSHTLLCSLRFLSARNRLLYELNLSQVLPEHRRNRHSLRQLFRDHC